MFAEKAHWGLRTLALLTARSSIIAIGIMLFLPSANAQSPSSSTRDGVNPGGPANRIQSSTSTPNYIPNTTGMRDDVYQKAQNFGILDNSFRVTSSLTNGMRKDAAVDFMITKATDPNNPDAAWLKMVPDRLLDPDDRAKINKAIKDVVSLTETKDRIANEHTTRNITAAQRAKTSVIMKEAAERGYVDVNGAGRIEYHNLVTGKTETLQDDHLMSLARSVNAAGMVDVNDSYDAAARIREQIINAHTTNNWSAFPDLPIDSSTGRPTEQNLLQYIAKKGGMNQADIMKTKEALGEMKAEAYARQK